MERFGGRRRAAVFALAAGIPAIGAAPGTAATDPGLVAEVRVFEIRRLNSDFSPLEGLSLPLDSDGVEVPASHWLATLARRIPDAYFAQLLTFGPLGAAVGETPEAILRRDGRTVAVRVSRGGEPGNGAAGNGGLFTVELALRRRSGTVLTMRREAAIEPGSTLVMSGRDFEISPTDYLTWFRAPGDLEARGDLYRKLRDHSIFLALGVTLRARSGAGDRPPLRLRPPTDPRLLDLDTSLVGAASGTVRLRVRLDDAGAPRHIEVLETTLPEVTPRVLGIVAGWRFPRAAGREGRLALSVASR